MKFLETYNEITESLRSDGSAPGSILKDVLVGNVYLQIAKSGKQFSVKKATSDLPTTARFKTVFTGSEEAANKKFNGLWQKAVKNL